jgi:hypothetical protein
MILSPDSLRRLKQVAADLVQERLVIVKELENDKLTGYSIMKDHVTGEHYLHYAYLHHSFNSREPAEESFHYLLPIESDDVLGMMFGEQGFTYPEHWQHAFLRNGPLGTYVWYDPTGEIEEAESFAMAQQIQERLLRFKQESYGSPEEVGRLMEEFERLRRRKPQID